MGASSKNNAKLFRSIEKRKISAEAFTEELKADWREEHEALKTIVGLKAVRRDHSQLKALNISSTTFNDSLQRLETMFSLLPSAFIEMDLSIARGLAYYTGIVFEAFDVSGEFRALGGGGRYDDLIALYEGEKTPATGFGIGLETLSLLLDKKKLLPEPQTSVDYYIAPVTENLIGKALVIAKDLRLKASVVVDVNARKLSKQFEYAQTIGAKNVVIVGEKDLKEGVVTIRDMTTGKERKEKI